MGSPITLSGFNNIDFKTITSIIIRAERQPIDRLEAQKKTEQSRLTAYGNFNSNLNSLKSAFDALKSSTAYGNLKATSSDTSVLTASTTSTSATKGSFTIDVVSLARAKSMSTEAGRFGSTTDPIVDSGSFKITQGGVDILDLTDFSQISSLEELRDAINNGQAKVRAAIINDGSATNPYRLVLTSSTPGLANDFTVTDTTTYQGIATLKFGVNPTVVAAVDTEFTYNGITIKSTSTNVTDAIPGLSINLLKESASSVVSVSDDDSSLKAKIKSAVDAFNSFNDFAKGQFKLGTTPSGRPPLANDALLRGVNRQLRNLLTSDHSNSGTIKNASELGIRLNQSGKLTIDDAALDAALANKRDDVKSFLSGDSGFAARVGGLIDGYTRSGGSIDSVEGRIQKTIDNYSSRIQTLEVQLVFREQTLNKQFAAADEAISQLNNQAGALATLAGQFRLF